MRKTFVEKLLLYAKKYPSLMVVTGDLGYSVFEPFMQKFPEKFINAGIAEQNMMGMSAGLALSGKIVFAYSITPFATVRPLEQIRVDICYHNLPVRIIGTGAGLSYGTLGPTHHGTEDLALMRAMPNMAVCAPADKYELAKIMDASMKMKTPLYIRIGRSQEPDVHSFPPPLKIGKGLEVYSKGGDFAIISCGNMVHTALQAAAILFKEGKKGKVISMHTIKPLDSALVLSLAKKMPLFTLEEHSIIGGLGSAVAETLADAGVCPPVFERFALPDAFQKAVGKHEFLRMKNGLTPEAVAKKIIKKL
ncbi:1-deoxy-D-xylulose-5-phosphate synthase [Candidatus Micrarchaeota archaeon CG10_big_fil_rev_8_21_14_0_10_45_29]|nr:MAG: 1-deoxy-D-xylulose-5-phosphate synthase [Candidatus Micrarchaeota archaeon CG10_big_fil_rev_8_21_14_0_10_45_29]